MICRMRRSDSPAPIAHIFRLRIFPDPATLPLPVYRDFVDMLFSMRLPIFGLGAVFVGICILASHEFGSVFLFGLAGLGAVTTLARLFTKSEEPTSELQSPMRISYAVFCLTKTKTILL